MNEAASQLGSAPISMPLLSRWIDKRLLRKSDPRGRGRGLHPHWFFSDDAAQMARIIVAFRSLGVHRINLLRLILWAFGYEYPIEDVKKSLQIEFHRLAQMQRRGQHSKFDHRFNKLSASDEAKLAHRLPVRYPGLSLLMRLLPAEAMVKIVSEAHWGKKAYEITPKIISHELVQKFSFDEEKVFSIVRILSIAGVFGAPDEIGNSGEAILERVTEADLTEGRGFFLLILFVLFAGSVLIRLFPANPEANLDKVYDDAMETHLFPQEIVATLTIFTVSNFRLRSSESVQGVKRDS
jgi:hypothetical protein